MIDRSTVEFDAAKKTDEIPELKTAQESPARERALQNAASIASRKVRA
jgi:hypothetical protein